MFKLAGEKDRKLIILKDDISATLAKLPIIEIVISANLATTFHRLEVSDMISRSRMQID